MSLEITLIRTTGHSYMVEVCMADVPMVKDNIHVRISLQELFSFYQAHFSSQYVLMYSAASM